MTIFLILKTIDGLGTSNFMCKQVLTCAQNSSSKIPLGFWVAFKFEIFTLFLHSWLMSIFVASNGSWIFELTWKQDAMVARVLDCSCNISCLVISLSKGLMLELGGVTSLWARLGQFASMELKKLGLAIIVLDFPSIKSYLCLTTFLVA
jgi:hypothetical protein